MKSIDQLLWENAAKYGEEAYLYEKVGDFYRAQSYAGFYRDVLRFARVLRKKGLEGKKIGIYSENSCLSMAADLAVLGYTGVSVALSEYWDGKQLLEICGSLELDAILYAPGREDSLRLLRERFPSLCLLSLYELQRESMRLPEWKYAAAARRSFSGAKYEYAGLYNNTFPPGRWASQSENGCVKIVFSSGSTGEPKAVMLSLRNIFANQENTFQRAPIRHTDRAYLFLPLSHTFGEIGNFLYSLISGMKIALSSRKDRILSELAELHPTVLCAVPLVLERIYRISEETGKSISALLGGNIRFLFSGGAALRTEIRAAIKSERINLIEAYGLTETASIISLEYSYQSHDISSSGTVLENQSVRIAKPDSDGIGEICVKGDNVFIGYYGREDYYRSCFDRDGYFHTGDLGFLRGGKLYLKGRKTRMILRSNGQNVYPEELEQCLRQALSLDRAELSEEGGHIHARLYSGELPEDGLLERVNDILPKYAQIESVELLRKQDPRQWK